MGSAVMAGFPSPAEQYVERPLDLNELLVTRPAETYFVRAAGDSMEGVGIRSGDLLVVDRSLEPWDRSVVIACVDGEFTVKTFRRGRGGVRLEAANPAYKPIRFKDGMEEAASAYAASAAAKLRRAGMVASVANVYVQECAPPGTGGWKDENWWMPFLTVTVSPTSATPDILSAVRPAGRRLFVSGRRGRG